MKKTIIMSGLLALTLSAQAAVTFTAPEQIPYDGQALSPVLSPDGSQIIVGAIHGDYFTLINISDGATRHLGTRTSSNQAPAFELDRAKPTATADYRTIRITDGKFTREISPLTDAHSYLWASLSPDGKRLLFTEPFEGVFVADADGSNPMRIAAKGDFPAWVDDNTVAYVLSHDDGYVILDAAVMLCDLSDMSTTRLTDPATIVGESSAAAGTVVFTTPDGKIFKSNVRH